MVILLIIILLALSYKVIEQWGATSPGTLLQLNAKGSQDYYLTGPPQYPYYPYFDRANFYRPMFYRA